MGKQATFLGKKTKHVKRIAMMAQSVKKHRKTYRKAVNAICEVILHKLNK